MIFCYRDNAIDESIGYRVPMQKQNGLTLSMISLLFFSMFFFSQPVFLLGQQAANDINGSKEATTDLKLMLAVEAPVSESAYIWNWSAWDQDKIVTFGDYQYTVFWGKDMAMVIGRRNLKTNATKILRLEKYKLKSNDRHRNTCLGVSKNDGRLHLSWDHHNDPLRYTKSRAGFLTDPPENNESE